MRSNYSKGFVTFFILSILVNFLLMIFLNKSAENLAADLLHIIPAGIFNELLEIFTPVFPDFLFLIPIGVTDGIIGLIIGGCLRINSKRKLYNLLIISFVIFEIIDVNYIPLFMP